MIGPSLFRMRLHTAAPFEVDAEGTLDRHRRRRPGRRRWRMLSRKPLPRRRPKHWQPHSKSPRPRRWRQQRRRHSGRRAWAVAAVARFDAQLVLHTRHDAGQSRQLLELRKATGRHAAKNRIQFVGDHRLHQVLE